MSSFDTWRLTLPSGDVFESSTIEQINEQHVPAWLFDGAGNVVAAAEQITGSSGSLKGQIYVGSGAGARIWRCTITQNQGSTDSWGSSSSSDDVTQKIQELGETLATTRIDSTNAATFEWGEYSTAGSKSPQSVVVGEVDLPAELADQPSSFTFTVDLLETKDLTAALHPAP